MRVKYRSTPPYAKTMKKERLLRIFCVDFVRKMCPGVTIIGSMNDVWLGPGIKKYGYIETLKKLGCLVADEPDLMLRWAKGNTLYIELKCTGETPRKGQEERLISLNESGFAAEWVDSADDFLTILKLHHVPIRSGAIYLDKQT